MKIIHLSDLHLGYVSKQKKYTTIDGFAKIIRSFEELMVPHSDYTIVITGDIVNDARKRGSYDTAKQLVASLEKRFRVLLVPGNHDYGNGVRASAKFVSRFKEYFFGDPNVTYPKTDLVGNVLFIGLDSMAEEVDWYHSLWADGELGRAQLGRLAEIVKAKEHEKRIKVVYLHHHPFHPKPFHELKDSQALEKVIAGKVDALLFGHNHAGDNLNGGRRVFIPRCYDGGSSTRKLGMRSAIRIFDPDPKKDPRLDHIMEVITEIDLEK
jgi:3',5'-cyclic AMP phosphodiesterase CpdA